MRSMTSAWVIWVVVFRRRDEVRRAEGMVESVVMWASRGSGGWGS